MRVSRSVFAGGLLVAAAGLLVFGLLCRNGGPVLAEPGAEPVPAEAAELQPAGGAPAQPATYAVTLPAEDEARKARPAPPSPGAIGLPPPPGPPPGLQRRPPGERPSGPPPPLPEELRKGPPTDVPTHLPNPEELREHFALLQRFLELPPERLARIRESIERIERLPEERKQMMLEHIRRAQPVAPRKVLVSPLTEVPAEMRPRLESAGCARHHPGAPPADVRGRAPCLAGRPRPPCRAAADADPLGRPRSSARAAIVQASQRDAGRRFRLARLRIARRPLR